MNKKKFIFIIILSFFLPSLVISNYSPSAKATTDSIDFEEIDSFIESQKKLWNIPDLSVAVVDKDTILFEKSYGENNSSDNYLIGSISKSFTAITTMQLYEKGSLDIDKPVKHYLPWFELKNNRLTEKITVRHLLNQTSGFPRSAGFFTPKSTKTADIESEYQLFLKSLSIDKEAIGIEHIYCNLNYEILGQIIQKVSGLSYSDYVQVNIFEPVGMNHTFANKEAMEQFGIKPGYQYLFGFPIKRSFEHNNNDTPAGDISSNTRDMAKFMQTIINQGKTETNEIITQASLEEMHTLISNRYGMGFSIGDWNGLHSVRHTGLSKNYSSAINILPDNNLGIVILTNVNSFYATRTIMDGLIRRLNNQEIINYIPYEIYVRYFVLVMLLWTLIEFVLTGRTWYKNGFPLTLTSPLKLKFQLFFDIALSFMWLIIVPILAKIPLTEIPVQQPDLGSFLIIGTILGILRSILKYMIKSNELSLKVDR